MESKKSKELAENAICSLLDLHSQLIDEDDNRKFDVFDIINKLLALFPDENDVDAYGRDWKIDNMVEWLKASPGDIHE